jgi:hypothetical protein
MWAMSVQTPLMMRIVRSIAFGVATSFTYR